MIDSNDEDHDEDKSKVSSHENMDDVLSEFRAQWQKELKVSSDVKPHQTNKPSTDIISENGISIENKAKALFMKGIEHEQSGKLYEAVCFYKKAVQLVPDIEFRLYEQTKAKEKNEPESDDVQLDRRHGDNQNANNDDDGISEDSDEEFDLLFKLSQIVNSNQLVCLPRSEQSTTHISALPLEIVLYILRWVVSIDLDLRSLEMFSTVCRGFYVSARDPEIWRLACARAWGLNCGHYEPRYQSWREMYLQRPRLRFNGCYISRTTYLRHGESGYQDAFYKPWYLVEYFRYLRFFPEGKVLMLTSTEEAQSCVNYMRSRNPLNPSVLIGHYRLQDNYVNLYLKKQETKTNNDNRKKRKGENYHDNGEQTFHIELNIQNHQKKINSLLHWVKYNIYTKYKNGEQTTSCLTLGTRYPPFKFSRVKSYTRESEAPLQ